MYNDQKRLRQILSNLVSNSLKFTNKGKIEVIIDKENNSNTEIISKDLIKITV